MPDSDDLPTIGQAISAWLGVQLPTVPMPQTLRNFDKAVGKILLAVGENVEIRVKGNTAKTKVRGKIDVEGMYSTEESKRKIENRASTTKAALEEMQAHPGKTDAQSEIDEDWLNLFARIAEDKSSEELQILFGKILAGEVKRPGSFSLRTMQILATISKSDAERLSRLLSFAINGTLVPFQSAENGEPTNEDRLFLEELGVASHPNQIGGMAMDLTAPSNSKPLLHATHRAIVIENKMSEPANFSIPGQILTGVGRELLTIANSPPTDLEFLKKVARQIAETLRVKYATQMDDGRLKIQVAATTPETENTVRYHVVFTVEK